MPFPKEFLWGGATAAQGVEPLVTLQHFDVPVALALKQNGWASRATIDAFVRYTKTVFSRYKGKVRYWLTINEINAVARSSFMPMCRRVAFIPSGV